MGHVYYILGILVFLLSLSNILNHFHFFKVKEWIYTFNKITNRNPIKSEFRSNNDYLIYVGYNVISMIQTIWLIFGIVTKSWYIYMFLVIISTIIGLFFQNYNNIKLEKYLILILNTFKLVMILALIINHFHFHKDWIELFITN